MDIVRGLDELKQRIRRIRRLGKTIGLVPTMGAFHQGHISLIRKAQRENDFVVVSIFVNPLQFDRRADFRSYPRPLLIDTRAAAREGTDLLFVPSTRQMYPPDFQTYVEVTRLSRPWEGRFRPGHFRGVTTVVTKLFHLVKPDRVYFGAKDAQQARIVGQLIRDLDFDLVLHILPTVRETDGLAMSSRNVFLSSKARRSSRVIFEALQEARRLVKCGERRGGVVSRRMKGILTQDPRARLEYAAVVDPKTLEEVKVIRKPVWALLAVWIGKVRLIDQATLTL